MMALAQTVDSEFQPIIVDCDQHGRWQQNVLVDGVVRFLPRCPKCVAEHQIMQVMGRAAVPKRFVDKRLEGYKASLAGQKVALAVAEAYVNDFESVLKTGRSLLFAGMHGTGKTHLAVGIRSNPIDKAYL